MTEPWLDQALMDSAYKSEQTKVWSVPLEKDMTDFLQCFLQGLLSESKRVPSFEYLSFIKAESKVFLTKKLLN